MNTIEIPFLQEQKTLAKALNDAGYPVIPSNVILDKTLTGIGATYMEIKSKRKSIIIEPNVPVIIGKIEQHPECLGVYKGITDAKIKKYLLDTTIAHKKVLTTPESFKRVKAIAESLDINLHADYFCLFDECEKIGQDYDFRNSIAFPINDFFEFKNKAFVSATPVGMANKELEKRGFTTLKIVPLGMDHKVDLKLITTNVFMRTTSEKLQSLLDNQSSCIFVFYNSIRGICALIEQFKIPAHKYAVFCADSRYNELKTKGYNVQKQVTDSTIKQLNFLTSRYFSAVDFKLSVCPDIVLLTNQALAAHSKIDPLSEAVQIQGRFRNLQPNGKRFNSMCHITDIVISDFLTPEQIDETLQQWYKTAKDLKERYNATTSEIVKKAILHEYKKSPIFPYLDTPDFQSEFKINMFSLLNKIYVERVKSCYGDSHKLIQAYSDADYFNITHIDAFDYTLTLDSLDLPFSRMNKNTPQREQIQAILTQLQLGVEPNHILILLKNTTTSDQYVNAQTVIEAVLLLGIDTVSKKTTFKAIEQLLESEKQYQLSEQKRKSEEVIQKIKDEFSVDLKTPILKAQIKQRLEKIYSQYDFTKMGGKPFSVTLSTIEDYFECKSNNQTRTYTLNGLKPELEAKLTAY